MRESPLLELVSTWASISPEEQLEALLAHRGLVNAVEPGLWEQLHQQRKAQDQAAKEQRKIDAELLRRQKAIPTEIKRIQRSLQRHSYRDERQQQKLDKMQDKLTKTIIKQLTENHV